MQHGKYKKFIASIFSITTFFVLFFALPATATTLHVDNSFYGVNNVDVTFNGNDITTSAAELRVYFDGNSGSFLPAFCVDLSDPLSVGVDNHVKSLQSPESYNPANGLYTEWLMDSFSVQLGYKNSSIGLVSSYQGAGLQLAIWETFYDLYAPTPPGASTPYNLDYDDTFTSYAGTGIFSYDRNPVIGGVNDEVNKWYDFFIQELVDEIDAGSLFTSTGKYIVAELTYNNIDKQDLMTVNPVPEPSTIMLFGLGLLGIGAIGRKKTQLK